MPLKPVTDPNLIKELENSSSQFNQPKLKRVTDPELIKSLETNDSGFKSFIKGFTHNFDEYAASFNKFAQDIVDKVVPDKYNTHFFEKNAEYWNKQKKLNELENL